MNFDPAKKGNFDMVCRYCKKSGHLIESCYKLHGYPPSFCSKYKKQLFFARVSNSPDMGAADNSISESSKVIPLDIGGNILTNEQYDQLLSLLQLSKMFFASYETAFGSTNFVGLIGIVAFSSCDSYACNFSKVENEFWILYFGDTNHMTHHQSLLTDIKPSPYPTLSLFQMAIKLR